MFLYLQSHGHHYHVCTNSTFQDLRRGHESRHRSRHTPTHDNAAPYAPTRPRDQRVQRHNSVSTLVARSRVYEWCPARSRAPALHTRTSLCTAHTSCTRADVSSAAPSRCFCPATRYSRVFPARTRKYALCAPSVLMARPSSEARHVRRRPSASSCPPLLPKRRSLGACRSAAQRFCDPAVEGR